MGAKNHAVATRRLLGQAPSCVHGAALVFWNFLFYLRVENMMMPPDRKCRTSHPGGRWLRGLAAITLGGLLIAATAAPLAAKAIKVSLVKTGHGWQLLRGGKPYFIKGSGGSYSLAQLKACGGDSGRTWGAGGISGELKEAAKLHMSVSVGFWLGHPSDGFNYHNAAQVHAQYEQCRRYVLKYRNDPAVLMWGIGNEMENGYDHKILWQAVEQIARMCHRLDPNHPTMTVVAEIGGHKVRKINKYCPDIDVIGINSYGGGPSLYKRYLKAGGYKPYVITEYGPPGTWEIGRNNLGVPVEETSTQKALAYAATYQDSIVAARGMCLGGYAFAWGWKVEATPTWYGLWLPDGRRLGGVDVLEHFWSGHWPAHLCPAMHSLKLFGPNKIAPGKRFRASVVANEPGGGKVTFHWILRRDISKMNIVAGLGGAMPTAYPAAIRHNGRSNVTVRMPKNGGYYRLYCYVYNHHKGAAVGNIPIFNTGKVYAMRAPQAELPLIIYGSGKHKPYIPAGWMGDYSAVQYHANCHTDPHAGGSCLKLGLKESHGWGGIAWQDPANDWGKTWGGLNLTGAKELSFWARGKHGGERVTFGIGIIGSNQKYHDSSRTSRRFTLSRQWKHYTINLKGKNLSRVITGFYWTGGADGSPLTFYLDDVKIMR